MSADPPYGYLPCCMPRCKGKMHLYFDPNDFTFSRLCRSCRRKKSTHRYEPFCVHGNRLSSLEGQKAICGCTIEKDIDNAAWDWIAKEAA